MILATGQWGTPHYSQPATEEWLYLTAIWGTCYTLNIENQIGGPWCVISGPIIVSWYVHYVWYSQPASEECPITPNRPLRNRQLYGPIGHIKHWKPRLGAPMCYLGTNSPLLIYALCVILPTGHWRTPHCSQPATEEWLHLTARWWTSNTLNIENHVWWPRCVIFDHIIQSWCLSYRGNSQPSSEERPITPNRPLRNIVCMGR